MFVIPKEVEYCINEIENQGFEAWCVGGAVRDLIMNVTPGDYDITTNAKPQDIISIFPKTVPTGLKHGTVTVLIGDYSIEVTTYRVETGYSNHRSPDNVSFLNNLDGDLLRRDFTMNTVCYHPTRKIYDKFGGIDDINKKTIRAVGDAKIRFEEDALRIMRAFRFSAQLGFKIQEATFDAAIKCSSLLSEISAERIAVELKKSFVSDSPHKISPLISTGALSIFGMGNCDVNKNISLLENNFALRFASFSKDNGFSPDVPLKLLKFDNETIKSATKIYEALDMKISTKRDIKQLLRASGEGITRLILNYKMANGNDYFDIFNDILQNNEPYMICQLDISGDDVLSLGFDGKEIGEKLDHLLNLVIENPELNSKSTLIKLISNN